MGRKGAPGRGSASHRPQPAQLVRGPAIGGIAVAHVDGVGFRRQRLRAHLIHHPRFSDEGAPGKTGDGGLGALFNVASTGKSGSTVTTGVRGLSEENLKTAQPNPQALKTIRGYAANADNATSFARAGKLEKNNMDYLPPARKGE